MEKIYTVIFCMCSSFIIYCTGQETSIECPFPEGTVNVTASRCNDFSGCVWTNGKCHMGDEIDFTYDVTNNTGGVLFTLTKNNLSRTLFGGDIETLSLQLIYHEDYHLQMKILDPTTSRYEVPYPLVFPQTPGSSPLYHVVVSTNPFAFQVLRNATNSVILSSIGPLTYESQFIQITFKLASTYLYGLGENSHLTLRHPFIPRTTFPLWCRGQGFIEDPVNLYGHHPLFMVLEDDEGNSHSVYVHNSNPMEYSSFLLEDGTPALTIRTIGGILDFHIFMGPTPEMLNQQYNKMIGFPDLPPYFTLGFHLSRYGYNDTQHVRQVVQRQRDAGIPQDIQTCDINYMQNYRDFTIDQTDWADLPELAQELHDDDLKLTLILDPPMVIDWDNYPPAQRGRQDDVFIKWSLPILVPPDQPNGTSDYVVGYMWPDNKTVFPDFMLQRTKDWWANEVDLFHEVVPFDTLWIDMNEPINFGTDQDRPYNYPPELPDWSLKCPQNQWDSPPYPTATVRIDDNQSDRLSDNTLCMSSAQSDGNKSYLHYDVHSLYGLHHAQATYQGLQLVSSPSRPFVLSRSNYVGTGRWAAHWLGDNISTWNHMKLSIIGILEFNMFGIPMVGADICGHFSEPTPELCARWMQLGSFYSFSRNHNNENNRDQDPASWGPEVTDVSRKALLIRYSLLPYLYTLLYKAHTQGSSVLRPLFNSFPDDIFARDVDDAFLWGDGLLVAPVVKEGATQRDVYFPKGLWYDFETYELISDRPTLLQGFPAPLQRIPLFLHGGRILPTQTPDIRTDRSRLNPMQLIVSLDDTGSAFGDMYWDDGDTLNPSDVNMFLAHFNYSMNTLTHTPLQGLLAVNGLYWDAIQILGVQMKPLHVEVNGVQLATQSWSYNDTYNHIHVTLAEFIENELVMELLYV